jgi:hypothetical protein
MSKLAIFLICLMLGAAPIGFLIGASLGCVLRRLKGE